MKNFSKLKISLNRNTIHTFLFLFAVLVGGIFRFYNLNWDEGKFFHPDETNILIAAGKVDFPKKLDPEFYAYNGLPVYLEKGTAQLFALAAHNETWKSGENLNILGRFYSAFFSSLSIILIYHLGKRLLNIKVGLLAAWLLAFSPGLIQYAHYSVTESMLVFFLLWMAIASIRIMEKNTLDNWLLMAIPFGLAIGSKVSALAYGVIPAIVLIVVIIKFSKGFTYVSTCLKAAGFAALSYLISFAVSPYTLLAWDGFKQSMDYEGGVVRGTIQVPYTVQFHNTPVYLYQWANLTWQVGAVVPILGFIGVVFWIYLIIKKKLNVYSLPFLIFGIFYFIYVGNWYTKFIRYMLPFIPVIILATAFILVYWYEKKKLKKIASGIIFVTAALSFLWSFAYMSVFTHESTRITASRWIYEHVPSGSTILDEHWDLGLPVNLIGNSATQYTIRYQRLYDIENYYKYYGLAHNMNESSFLTIDGRRLLGSISRAKDLYPRTSKYYDKLFNGDFGYELVKTISSYPSLGPLQIPDEMSEETFQVYDHPTIYIFQKVKDISADELMNILQR